MRLNRKVFDQCELPVLKYGVETLTFTNAILNKMQVTQRRMERPLLGITLGDKVPDEVIRERTGLRNAFDKIVKMKWNWAEHVARMTDDRPMKKLLH